MSNKLLTADEVSDRLRPFVEEMVQAQIEDFKQRNPGVPYDVFLVPASGGETIGHFEVHASTNAKPGDANG